jgi:hypothetical protein
MAARNKRRKKLADKTVFGSLRKPVAPPGHPLTQAKPDEKARPAGRKAKHKQRPQDLPGSFEAED